MNNTIYLERQCKVLVCADNESDNQTRLLVATIIKNIEDFGYTLSKSVIDVLENSSNEYITKFYLRLVKDLKSITGAKRKFAPMYPNFPKQVMDASEAELYLNAIMHYFGDFIGVRIMPKYEIEERMPMIEKTTLKVIGLGSKKDYAKMFTNLMASKTSISDSDKADLMKYIITSKEKIDLPDAMPNKEVMSFVIPLLREHTSYEDGDLFHYCKTATDILRLATAMSAGDISLAENTKFKSFSRSDRRYLLSMLEHCSGDIVEDMFRFRKKWIRLGERLHPSEYPYKKVKSAFETIRKKGNVERFSTQVERALENCDIITAAKLLEQRPGNFARRLDHLVRSTNRPSYVINRFRSVAHEVSTPLLLQVLNHFEHRNDGNPLRVVFPKGNVAKVKTLTNDLPPISKDNCHKIVGVYKNTFDIVKAQFALMSVNNSNYKIVSNLFHSQSIISKKYMNNTEFPNKSVGEDIDFESGARVGSFNVDPLYWYVYRWGQNIHHLSGISDDRLSWEKSIYFEPYNEIQGEVVIKPEFQQDYWKDIENFLGSKNEEWAKIWNKKIKNK